MTRLTPEDCVIQQSLFLVPSMLFCLQLPLNSSTTKFGSYISWYDKTVDALILANMDYERLLLLLCAEKIYETHELAICI